MRLLIVCLLVLSIPGAFFLGRETTGTTRTSHPTLKPSPLPGGHTLTMRPNDLVRFPAAATECFATAEAAVPYLLCEPTGPNGEYEVGFYADQVIVFHGPDNFPFSGRWAEAASFETPDRAAYCGVPFGSLLCWRPSDGLTLTMAARGRPQRSLDERYKGYNDPRAEPICCSRLPSRVLRFGRSWTRDEWSCVSRRAGLTCTNRAGHGWRLARERGSKVF